LAHAMPPVHATPHAPQLLVSLVRFTQAPEQSVSPVPHVLAQPPWLQTCVAVHAVVQFPQ
jgi:hypothetical protein